jgi:hypothetical protein
MDDLLPQNGNSRNIQIAEKNRSYLSGLELLRLIIGRLFIDQASIKKCLN